MKEGTDMLSKSDYKCYLKVRDYEIDMQGIVHHSVYINYLEHCRNTYVSTLGIDVHKYHELGYDLVIVHISQDYKSPLRPNDEFYVTAKMSRDGKLRIVFDQEIRRVVDDILVLKANVVSVCLNTKTGRPCMPDMLEGILTKCVIEQIMVTS